MKDNKVKNKSTFFEKVFTIKGKLMLSFLIAILLIIIMGIASYNKASTAIMDNYMKSTCQTLNITGEYLSFGFSSVQDTAAQLISDTNVIDYFSKRYGSDTLKVNNARNNVKKLLSSKSVTESFIENIYLLSDKVDPISTIKINSTDLYSEFLDTASGKKLQENKTANIWAGVDPYLNEKLNTGESDCSIRFSRNMASTSGIIIIDISAKTIASVMENINFDKSGVLGIVTADGTEIMTNKNDEAVFSDKAFYQEALKANSLNGSQFVEYQGEKNLFMYTKIGDSGAMICALISSATISKQADGIRLFTLIIAVIACIIAVFTGLMITGSIDKVIKSIIYGLKKASVGDLTVVFPSKRKDEFKILISEIQNTFSNMKELILGVKLLSGEVLASSKRVGETTISFQQSTENISYAMGEVEQGITQQAKDAEECLIEMDNLSQKIILISDNTKEIEKITGLTKMSILEGTQCTEKLNSQTKSTIQITTDIIKKVELQAQSSASINQISNEISIIANEINLLSLNASIESARAGEYGKGFEVIASRIRDLAEQSKKSVDDIKKITCNIQEVTKDTMQIAHNAEGVLMLQEKAVSETTYSYHNINLNVEQLVIYLKRITETINNVEESRIDTLGSVESISAVLEEIAASSNTVNQASMDQLTAVNSLGQSSEALSENANNLLNAVYKFTV